MEDAAKEEILKQQQKQNKDELDKIIKNKNHKEKQKTKRKVSFNTFVQACTSLDFISRNFEKRCTDEDSVIGEKGILESKHPI